MNLDDRMKAYESQDELLRFAPAIIRIDGRAFHTFTKDMKKPFDKTLTSIFNCVLYELMKETSAFIGYTQSYEISLCLYQEDYDQQLWFGGKIQKICGIVASFTTQCFIKEWMFKGKIYEHRTWLEETKLPQFDARCFSLPNLAEVHNYFLWRERDCIKNSVNSLGRAHFSHKEMYEKSQADVHEMLHQKGINWSELSQREKVGLYLTKSGQQISSIKEYIW